MTDTKKLITGKHEQQTASPDDANYLFPIFLKLEQLSLLIVGGGYVGNEKLTAVLQNSPKAKIKLVAISISEEIKGLAKNIYCSKVHYRDNINLYINTQYGMGN